MENQRRNNELSPVKTHQFFKNYFYNRLKPKFMGKESILLKGIF